MALYKRGKRYWTEFEEAGVLYRKPLRPQGKGLATTNWQEATRLEKEVIEAARKGHLDAKAGPTRLFEACTAFLDAKKATGDTDRNVEYLTERLNQVKNHFGDIKLTQFTRELFEGYQAHHKLKGKSNRTINMDLGALRQVLKRYRQWRRLEDQVSFLSEAGGDPIGRALTHDELRRFKEAAKTNAEWEHVYCAAMLAGNTSMSGVEIKNLRRWNVNLEKATIEIRKSKGGKAEAGRKRLLPLNASALEATRTMLERMDVHGWTDPEHYIWCASRHHNFDPTKPATSWNTAWNALRKAAGLPWLRFHDLRHTVVTELLENGVPDHVVEAITGHLSKRMLQHYSHIRMNAKKTALDQLDESRKAAGA